MSTEEGWKLRLAILSTLIKNAPSRPGRTALMKFLYLLQTVKKVPLGYRFELYNYGPYDASVLNDITQATALRAVKSSLVSYPSGYGYEYSSNEKGHNALCKPVIQALEKHQESVDWVLEKYGEKTASHLELITTVIFTEREMKRKKQKILRDEIINRVSKIKPHFSEREILEAFEELRSERLIEEVNSKTP